MPSCLVAERGYSQTAARKVNHPIVKSITKLFAGSAVWSGCAE
jgi:hypothetical protein